MQDMINQIAEKLGIDESKATEVANHLQGGGNDLAGLLQGGDFMEKAKDLMGDKFGDLVGGIPGIGGMLGGLLGGEPEQAETQEPQ